MVKNKGLPDSARPCCKHPRLVTLSFCLIILRLGPVTAGLMCLLSLADAVHPEGTPWILPRVDPGRCVCQVS